MLKRKMVINLVKGVLLTATIALATTTSVYANTIKGDKTKTKVKFAVMSDVHIRNGASAEDGKFANALKILGEKDANLDAILFAGDLADSGTSIQYDRFNKIYSDNVEGNPKRLTVMGNHDYWNGLPTKLAQKQFEAKMGNELNSHEIINGFHFIQVSTQGGSTHGEFPSSTVSWLDEELKKAAEDDPNKPIFVTVHQHIKDTVYGSDDWGNAALYDSLKPYPQVVTFSGHSHYALDDERSIHQRDFTSVGTSSLSYMELESGKIQGSVPPGAGNVSEGLLVEVDENNKVEIEKIDFTNNKTIKSNWVIENPTDKSKFVYTDDRASKRLKPYFNISDRLKINSLTDTTMNITFDQGHHDDLVHSYKVQAVNKGTGKVDKEFLAFSEFYFGINMPKKLSFDITGLKASSNYEIRVYAIESFGNISDNYLKADGSTIKPINNWSSENVSYKSGDMVKYNDVVYLCMQNHNSQTSWNPKDSTSLWKEFYVGNNKLRWTANLQYEKGDEVEYKGITYICNQDNISQADWTPDIANTLWYLK